MVARVNELPWQQDESLYLSHFLRHKKLKFSIQIPPDLRKESFWLLGGFGYHCNTKVSSCQPLLNIECSNCVCRSFKIFLNLVLGKNGFYGNKMENQYLSLLKVYKVQILLRSLHKINFLLLFSNENAKY